MDIRDHPMLNANDFQSRELVPTKLKKLKPITTVTLEWHFVILGVLLYFTSL
jgi:hypothetical protein